MECIGDGSVWQHLAGDRRPRRRVIVSTLGIVGLASVAFLLGLDVALYEFSGWLVVGPILALLAGVYRAGFVSTVGSLWVITLCGYVFPPLVGYLSGEWGPASRYTHPRMMGFAYGSARAELVGGLESAVEVVLVLAVLVGALGYVPGALVRWTAERMQSFD